MARCTGWKTNLMNWWFTLWLVVNIPAEFVPIERSCNVKQVNLAIQLDTYVVNRNDTNFFFSFLTWYFFKVLLLLTVQYSIRIPDVIKMFKNTCPTLKISMHFVFFARAFEQTLISLWIINFTPIFDALKGIQLIKELKRLRSSITAIIRIQSRRSYEVTFAVNSENNVGTGAILLIIQQTMEDSKKQPLFFSYNGGNALEWIQSAVRNVSFFPLFSFFSSSWMRVNIQDEGLTFEYA